MPPPIRLVTFDALYTLLRPRQPIHVQYAHVFEPYFGRLPPPAVKRAFKQALAQVQASRPSYTHGHRAWWALLINTCALNAGAPPSLVAKHLDEVTDKLLRRFSSEEGYARYDDAIPTLTKLKSLGVHSGVVTNADNRMHQVLTSLSLAPHLSFTLTSEDARVEKPDARIFRRACASVSVSVSPLSPSLRLGGKRKEREREEREIRPEEVLHVGDELLCDYKGALAAGMHALLLIRPPDPGSNPESNPEPEDSGTPTQVQMQMQREHEHEQDGDASMVEPRPRPRPSVRVIGSLEEVVPYVLNHNHNNNTHNQPR